MMKQSGSLENLFIPDSFTAEHDIRLRQLMRDNKTAYEEVHNLAYDLLKNPFECKKKGINFFNQTMSDLFRLMYSFAVQKKYIK